MIPASFALSCGDEGVPLQGPFDGGPRDVEIRNGCPALREPVIEDLEGDSWETWARDDFFAMYCIRCHSTENVGDERNGAPPDYNWDDEASVRAHLDDIRYAAGVVNYMPFMPGPGDPVPDCETRRRMVRWIDGSAP
jgi:hypothetical protein